MGKIEQKVINSMSNGELGEGIRAHFKDAMSILPNMDQHNRHMRKAVALSEALQRRPATQIPRSYL